MKKPTLVLLALLASSASRVLAQEDPIPLEGLVVTASPTVRPLRAMSTHVTVLDGDSLRGAGFTKVEEALRDVAGVALTRNGAEGSLTSLFMRGGESDYVLVMVDGVQVNQPGGAFDLGSLTLANVERVEVVRGPASALYGSDAVAGVVNVITRVGAAGTRAEASTRTGSYGRLDWTAGASGGGDAVGYSVSLARTSTEGILPFNNDYRQTVLSGAMRYRAPGSTDADLSVRLSDRQYNYPTDGSGAVVDTNAFDFGDETVVGTRVRRDVSSRVSLEARLGLSESDGGTDDAPDGPADTLGFYGFTSLDHTQRASADVRTHVVLEGATLTFGGEIERERQRSFTESLSAFGPSTGRSENARVDRAVYAHATSDGRLSLNAGGRLEDNERFGTLATWQLGGAWALRPDGAARVRASVARGIKEPTFFENYATGFAVGNPDLDPERATSWEVGADASLGRGRANLSATYFDQSFVDLIQYTGVPPTPGGPNFFNVAAADSRGVEATATTRLQRVSGSVSWTWLSTRVRDAGFDSGAGATFVEGEPLMRRPSHTVSLGMQVDLGRARSLSGGVRFVGARADRDFGTFPATPVELERYANVWLGGSVRLAPAATSRPGVTLTFGGDNLLDRAYQEVFGFTAPGRRLFVGVRVESGTGG